MKYNSIEEWRVPLILRKLKDNPLENNFDSRVCADCLSDLVAGMPPVQVFVHKDKFYGDYFCALFSALTRRSAVWVHMKTLKILSAWDVLDKEDKDYLRITDLMSTTEFFQKTKGLGLERVAELGKVATLIYEKVISVVKVDDSTTEEELIVFLDKWFKNKTWYG